MNITKLSIVIPAFNEGATIHHILDKVKDVQLENDIQKGVAAQLVIAGACAVGFGLAQTASSTLSTLQK